MNREPLLIDVRRRRTAWLVLAGTTLLSFQGGLLRVALPVIRSDLDASVGAMELVGVAGLVATIATVVIFGRLADMVGARPIYSAGLVVFAAGGALSALAPGTGALALAQVAQGLGWSMAVSAATPLLVQAFPPERRGRAVAANHMAVAVGLAAGPGAGGFVVEHLGWRTAMFVIAPVALSVGALVQRSLSADRPPGPAPHFDVPGAATLALGLTALLVVLDSTGHDRLPMVAVAGIAGLGIAAFITFLRVEAGSPEPTVDLDLFRNRAFSAGLGASFLNFVAMASNMFLMPFFLQEALGLSAGRAGTVMMAMPVGVLVTAPVAGKMADRVGPRLPATLGMGLITGAIAVMAGFTGGVSVAEVAGVLLIYGIGAGLFQSPNISGVLGAAPADRLGVASGTLSTLGRLGQVVGVAVAGGIWEQQTPAAQAGGNVEAFTTAFLVLALVGALATAASWVRGPVALQEADHLHPPSES